MKYLLRASLALALVGSLASVGCSSASVDEEVGTSSEALSAAQLAATKQALRAIANANTSRTDNFVAVRAQVDPLVAKLAAHFGSRSATSKLPLVAGAWHQLWSDYPFASVPFIAMEPTQVYQVVSADGHYWNIGDERAVGFVGLTGVLRGAFVPHGTKIDLKFTNLGFRFGRIAKGEDMVDLADGLESGDRYYIGTPGGGKAPNGPVGIEGTLETLYVDADLRVERGTQKDFVDADGKVLVPGYDAKIFVLDRVTTVAK